MLARRINVTIHSRIQGQPQHDARKGNSVQHVARADYQIGLGSRFGNSRIVDSGRLTFRRAAAKPAATATFPFHQSPFPLCPLSRDNECCVSSSTTFSPCPPTSISLPREPSTDPRVTSNNPALNYYTNLALPTLLLDSIVVAERLVAETLPSTPYVPHPSCYFHRRSGSRVQSWRHCQIYPTCDLLRCLPSHGGICPARPRPSSFEDCNGV